MATPPSTARRATGSMIKPLKPPSQQQHPPLSPSATAAEVSRLKAENAELSARLADVNARIAGLEAVKWEREQRRSRAATNPGAVQPTVTEEELDEGERQRARAQRERERERQHQRERERRHADRVERSHQQRSITPVGGGTDAHTHATQERPSAVPAIVHADTAQRPLSYHVRPLSMLPPSSTLAEELAATLQEEDGEEEDDEEEEDDDDDDDEAVFHEARMFIPTPRPSPRRQSVSPGGETPSPSPGHGGRRGADKGGELQDDEVQEREDAASAAARSDEYASALAKLQGSSTSEGSATARKTVARQMLYSAGRTAG